MHRVLSQIFIKLTSFELDKRSYTDTTPCREPHDVEAGRHMRIVNLTHKKCNGGKSNSAEKSNNCNLRQSHDTKGGNT